MIYGGCDGKIRTPFTMNCHRNEEAVIINRLSKIFARTLSFDVYIYIKYSGNDEKIWIPLPWKLSSSIVIFELYFSTLLLNFCLFQHEIYFKKNTPIFSTFETSKT